MDDIICFYEGNYLLPYGKPIVIISAWSNEVSISGERLVFLISRDETIFKQGLSVGINKSTFGLLNPGLNDSETLERFLDEQVRNAEFDLFSHIQEMNKEHSLISGIDFKMKKSPQHRTLSLLFQQDKEVSKWIVEKSSNDNLRDLILRVRRYKINELPIDS
ncbi:hypothetical protein [Roseivirga thermotolerans]|uniref:hypothetical protein n=1 Tax=Roseivirga thermotolerans TaxID=1758176 RepID=UPI00273DB07D|nr:hypothetical protein [Roseivirga thermotolerans]